MKLWWILSMALVCVSLSGAHAQLSVGPGGIQTPPINLLSIFKFLRDIWNAYMYPAPAIAEIQSKNDEAELIPVIEAEAGGHVGPQHQQQQVSVMGYDTQGNTIVEKFDSGCLDDGTGDCVSYSAEEQQDDLEDPPQDRTGSVLSSQEIVEDKTGSTQVVIGKWPILYISLISIFFWIFVILATPYILTGDTIGRREDDLSPNSIVDQQDVLLLLSWLLGEVSEDVSCLERVVCLTPTKSSQYISVSSMVFNVASYLQRWVPYSRRFDDLLHRLEDVTLDGFSQECHNYSCPTIPEL